MGLLSCGLEHFRLAIRLIIRASPEAHAFSIHWLTLLTSQNYIHVCYQCRLNGTSNTPKFSCAECLDDTQQCYWETIGSEALTFRYLIPKGICSWQHFWEVVGSRRWSLAEENSFPEECSGNAFPCCPSLLADLLNMSKVALPHPCAFFTGSASSWSRNNGTHHLQTEIPETMSHNRYFLLWAVFSRWWEADMRPPLFGFLLSWWLTDFFHVTYAESFPLAQPTTVLSVDACKTLGALKIPPILTIMPPGFWLTFFQTCFAASSQNSVLGVSLLQQLMTLDVWAVILSVVTFNLLFYGQSQRRKGPVVSFPVC